MKLLSKNEIQQKKAAERKLEIDEGVKLAKRIDGLRETVAIEENRLRQFKEATIPQVLKEIETLTSSRDLIKKEIEDLKEERRILQIPLDQEWEDLHLAENRLRESQARVDARIANLEEQENLLQQRLKDVEFRENAALEHYSKSLQLQAEAETTLNDVKKQLADAETAKVEWNLHVEEKSKELLSREADVATREREISMREESNLSKEKQLVDWERQLNDKWETLQRTIKRVNHVNN